MKLVYILSTLILIPLIGCEKQPLNKLEIDDTPTELELFGKGIISTNLFERDIAIAPDGNEIIYTLGDYKQRKRCLVHLKKSGNKWEDPEILTISGEYQDIEPFISPDGNKLFFASNRPIYGDTLRSDYNIWFATKTINGWSNDIPLDSTINSNGNEFYPSVSKNGNLYFTASYSFGKGLEDIYVSKLINNKYQLPEALDTMINTEFYEFNAYISPNEDVLVFSSFGRADGLGGGDLYFTKKDGSGTWSKSQNMGKGINSTSLDYCPFIDWERNNFYFTSERGIQNTERLTQIEDLKKYANDEQNGFGNIYRVSLDNLGIR